MENLLPITIKGAKITEIRLIYKEKELKYNAEVALLNQKDERITSIYVGNTVWEEKDRAELSLPVIALANQLREEINIAVIRHMNKHQNALEA